MSLRSDPIKIALSLVFVCSLIAPSLAGAHGEPGEHVDEFEEHLDDYHQEVEQLGSLIERVVEEYAADKDAAAVIDSFVESWEDVGVHLVIETKATPLYPSIWQGIVGLREAVSNEAPASEVRAAAKRLRTALWEGMGGVRLAAAKPELASAGGRHHGDASVLDIIHGIEHDLEHAVEDYAGGEVAEAKELIMQTYLNRFEGLEGELIEQDPKLVTTLEEDFNAGLPMLMDEGAPVEEVTAKLEEMKEALERGEQLLMQADTGKSKVF
jgi:hypothetical protein